LDHFQKSLELLSATTFPHPSRAKDKNEGVVYKDLFLLLSIGYWHQVRSYGSKNMAVSVLFSRLTEFDPTGCENTKLEYTPLSDVNMVWTYPGHGPQTMGNIDPFEMKYVANFLKVDEIVILSEIF